MGVTDNDRKSLQAFTASNVWSEAGESDASEQVQIQGIPESLRPKSNRKKSLGETQGFGCWCTFSVRVRTDMPYQPFGIYRQNVGKCRQERDRSASKKHDGWELEDDTYNIAWFDGDQLPGTLVPEEDDAVSNVGENDDDFVLSSDDDRSRGSSFRRGNPRRFRIG